jgi:hypothetical protein
MEKTREYKKQPQIPSFIWNKKKNKPSPIIIIMIITTVITLLIWGIIDLYYSDHDIKIVVDNDGTYILRIVYPDTNDRYFENGYEEFDYEIHEGFILEVFVSKIDENEDNITISIIDNGELKIERSFPSNMHSKKITYVVGKGEF